METPFKNFEEFYPFYLSQHTNLMTKRLHFAGCVLAIIFLLYFLISFSFTALFFAIIFGYGLSWAGHYLYEKNKPTTFAYPKYSLMADWVMFKDMVTGKISLMK